MCLLTYLVDLDKPNISCYSNEYFIPGGEYFIPGVGSNQGGEYPCSLYVKRPLYAIIHYVMEFSGMQLHHRAGNACTMFVVSKGLVLVTGK